MKMSGKFERKATQRNRCLSHSTNTIDVEFSSQENKQDARKFIRLKFKFRKNSTNSRDWNANIFIIESSFSLISDLRSLKKNATLMQLCHATSWNLESTSRRFRMTQIRADRKTMEVTNTRLILHYVMGRKLY